MPDLCVARRVFGGTTMVPHYKSGECSSPTSSPCYLHLFSHTDTDMLETPTCKRPLILDDALDGIGNTPLVRLDRLAKQHGLKCNLCKSCLLPAIKYLRLSFDGSRRWKSGVFLVWRLCEGSYCQADD